MADIDFIQTLYSSEIFLISIELFLKKYSQFEELLGVLDDFILKRIKFNKNWFEGAFVFSPSTNNCLEAYNGVLKNHTFEKKIVKIDDFILKTIDIFNDKAKSEVLDKPKYTVEEMSPSDNFLYKIIFKGKNFDEYYVFGDSRETNNNNDKNSPNYDESNKLNLYFEGDHTYLDLSHIPSGIKKQKKRKYSI